MAEAREAQHNNGTHHWELESNDDLPPSLNICVSSYSHNHLYLREIIFFERAQT